MTGTTVTGDDGVWAVIKGGTPVYGEEDFLKAAAGESYPSAYGRYETGVEALDGKYFLVPPLFEGHSFEELYEVCLDAVRNAGIDFSMLRASEDPVYMETLDNLMSRVK